MSTSQRGALACLLFILFWVPGLVYSQPVFDQAAITSLSGEITADGDHFLQTGAYFDAIDFDGDGIEELINRGGSDIFVGRFDLTGTLDWIQSAGGSAVDYGTPNDIGDAIAVDELGAVYVAGTFDRSADFDNNAPDDVSVSEPDTAGVFIAKYTAAGAFQWVQPLAGLNNGSVEALHYASETQTLYLTGAKYDDAVTASTIAYHYIKAINTNGVTQWTSESMPVGGEGISHINVKDLAVDDQGNAYLTGRYQGIVDFDGEGSETTFVTTFTGTTYLTSTFVLKYDANGVLQWVTSSADTGNSGGEALALDADGNLLVTGNFNQGQILFQNEETTFIGTAGFSNIFVTKLAADGTVLWASYPTDLQTSPFGLISQMYTYDVAIDNAGTAHLVGYVIGLLDLDDDGIADIATQDGNTYLASYTEEGNAQWYWPFSSSSSAFQLEAGESDQFYLFGGFKGSIDFDGTGDLPALFGPDETTTAYAIARYKPLDPPLPVQLTNFTATADGNTVTLQWQTASETNNAGFEVQVGADREPPARWATTTFIKGTGTTTDAQIYTHRIDPLEPGTYRFRLKQVDFDGTFAYSDEITLTIGLDAAYTLSEAFPNPFNPQATFSLSVAQAQQVRIDLYDLLGRRVQSIFDGTLPANETQRFFIDGSRLPSGTYLYRVEGERFRTSERVVLLK